jgi:hypothetical protein
MPYGVVQIVLIARDTKHTTIVELLGNWNDVKLKEAKLTLVPAFSRIHRCASISIRLVYFQEQALVPFAINIPVLHRVSYIRSLDQVLDDNGCLAVDYIGGRIFFRMLGKSFTPASIPVIFQFLVHNVASHDRLEYELVEAPLLHP